MKFDNIEKDAIENIQETAKEKLKALHDGLNVKINFAKDALQKPDLNLSPEMMENLDKGFDAIKLKALTSTIENFAKLMNDQCTIQEAIDNIAADIGYTAGMEAVSAFITPEVAEKMREASLKLISFDGNGTIPPEYIKLGLQLLPELIDFATDNIDPQTLLSAVTKIAFTVYHEMNNVEIDKLEDVRSIPGAGTPEMRVVGGMINTALAAEAYQTAIERNAENVDEFENELQDNIDTVLNIIQENLPKILDIAKIILEVYRDSKS